ncbi:hypothetical protein P9112_009472 [Eukaryota sp. TZLM1-RC]
MKHFFFSETEINELQESFELFGADGHIKKSSVLLAMRAIGQNPPEDKLNQLLNDYDVAKTGNISFQQFVDIAALLYESDDENQVLEMYHMLEKNEDNFIKISTFKKFVLDLDLNINEKKLDDIINNVDFDGTGVINFYQFNQLYTDLADCVE